MKRFLTALGICLGLVWLFGTLGNPHHSFLFGEIVGAVLTFIYTKRSTPAKPCPWEGVAVALARVLKIIPRHLLAHTPECRKAGQECICWQGERRGALERFGALRKAQAQFNAAENNATRE